jgi:hypothetical protein
MSVLMNVTEPKAIQLTFLDNQEFDTGPFPVFVAADDFNGDKKPDLVTVNRDSRDISILLNETEAGAEMPRFAEAQAFGSLTNHLFTGAIADINRDGKADVASLDSERGIVTLFINQTEPGADAVRMFEPPELVTVSPFSNSIEFNDFNGDGQFEMAAGYNTHARIGVFFSPRYDITDGEGIGTIIDNDGASPARGDINADGLVNSADIDLLFAAISAKSVDPWFDLNNDAIVNRTDVDELVYNILGTKYGDANLDKVFDSADLILIFAAGQYEDSRVGNSLWSTGDWDGDREFTTSDLVLALQLGAYRG